MSAKVLGQHSLRQQVEHEISMLASLLGAIAYDLDGITPESVDKEGLVGLRVCKSEVDAVSIRIKVLAGKVSR